MRKSAISTFNEKRRLKTEAAKKKNRAAERKQEAAALRERYTHLVGEHEATLTIGSDSVALVVKITKDKSGAKIKIAGVI